MKLFLPLVNCDNFVYRSAMGPYMSDGPAISGSTYAADSLIFDAGNFPQSVVRAGKFNSLNGDLQGVIAKRMANGNYRLVNEGGNVCIGYNQTRNVFERQPCDFGEAQSFSETVVDSSRGATNPSLSESPSPSTASVVTPSLKSTDPVASGLKTTVPVTPSPVTTNSPLKSILDVKKINEAGEGVLLDLPDNHAHDTLSDQINDLEILKTKYNEK